MKKKDIQLGMPIGTASGRLRKSILFSLLKELNKNYCFQCGSEITNEEDLSIEHKIPYLDSDNPKDLFFDLNNIAFSHLDCNIGAARKTSKIESKEDPRFKHGSRIGYRRGCRCDDCKESKRLENKRNRSSLVREAAQSAKLWE